MEGSLFGSQPLTRFKTQQQLYRPFALCVRLVRKGGDAVGAVVRLFPLYIFSHSFSTLTLLLLHSFIPFHSLSAATHQSHQPNTVHVVLPHPRLPLRVQSLLTFIASPRLCSVPSSLSRPVCKLTLGTTWPECRPPLSSSRSYFPPLYLSPLQGRYQPIPGKGESLHHPGITGNKPSCSSHIHHRRRMMPQYSLSLWVQGPQYTQVSLLKQAARWDMPFVCVATTTLGSKWGS